MSINYYLLKLIGIVLLPLFHGVAFLGSFKFPIFKYMSPYYELLFPFALATSTVFFIVGANKENKENGFSSDKVITFVGGFFIFMNFVVSIIVVSATKT
ncbi:hypothetical protein N9L48_04765 [Psychrosphaera sp.]|nr:hypothetical protein [Psychrosphaera sp.]